jgi:RHS repeat-associated protein
MRLTEFVKMLTRVVAFSGLFSALAVGQEVSPDFYKEPGLYPNREYVNQSGVEHIDPFTGALQLHHVDLHLPGNGGFDLEVVRSYNSTAINPGNPADYEPLSRLSGLGWSLHFGRVLKTKSAYICVNQNANTVADNPVLELPDGSRQLLAFTGNISPLMLTTQRWRADCITEGEGGLAVYSPDGRRYDMTQLVNIGAGNAPVYAWYTTRITDRNGNTATIQYAGSSSPEIKRVSASDGRLITFNYADSGKASRRITSITSSGQTYSYDYQKVQNTTEQYYLTRVIRPDGTSWQYSYNGNFNNSPRSYLIHQMTYPQGGYNSYEYGFVYFDTQANPASRSTVVTRKTRSAGGTWSFSYAPGRYNVYDVTTVNTPGGTVTYQHIGPNYTSSGTVWMVGLLMSKSIGNLQTETYTWDKQSISPENYFRPGAFVTKVDAGATNAPILTKRTIVRDGASHTTTYSNFDDYGNPHSMVESGPGGGNRSTSLSYYTNSAKWILHQPQNESFTDSSISRSFDGNGNLTSVTRNGVKTSYGYDSQGNTTSITDPRGLRYSYSRHWRGIPQSETQPEGVTITRTVSDAGNITSETNGEGYTTTYGYDGLNRVTAITYPAGSPVAITYGATTRTATRGALTERTDYNGFGDPISVTLGGISRSFTVDALGRKTFESNPGASIGTQYQYDILNRVTRLTHADNTFRTTAYGAGSQSVTDERGNVTRYSYRAYGDPERQYLMSITAPDASANLSVTRNSRDQVTAITQAGLRRSYSYNSNAYLTGVTHPETGTTVYGRDLAGNLTSRQVGASGVTRYSYDGQNRLTAVTYPGGTPAVSNTYNKTHKLLSANASTGSRSYRYDANGNLVQETLNVDGQLFTLQYAYNGLDQISALIYPTGTRVEYAPDALGRPTRVSGYINSVSYWPSGQIRQLSYANGATTVYDQNSRLWPSGFRVQKSNSNYLNSRYSYDGVGNLTGISDSVDSSYTRSFGYDELDRLVQISTPWERGSISYDGAGNIQSQTLGNLGLYYSYSGNRLVTLSGFRATNHGYDAYGNINFAQGVTYTYDDVPNLRCVNCDQAGTNKIEYSYDATNQRAKVVKRGQTHYEMYNARGELVLQSAPGRRQTEHIYLGGKRIAQLVREGNVQTPSYLHNDLSGTPQMATDSNGQQLWKESYLPFGERLRYQVGDEQNALWFAGKPRDWDTGLSYFGARYYDPLVGRFTGMDPAEVDPENLHSFNRYAYGNNNPYRYVDPDGHSPLDVAFLVWDIGKLGVAMYTGVGVGAAAADVAASVVGVASPIPFAGQAIKMARVADKAMDVARTSDKALDAAKGVTLSRSRFPESVAHIEDAQRAGKPSTLTIDRAGATANRRESMRGTNRVSGKDRDEYPPAMFKEGGKGASVRPIRPSDNRGAGACIGAQCQGLPNGTKVRIRITD